MKLLLLLIMCKSLLFHFHSDGNSYQRWRSYSQIQQQNQKYSSVFIWGCTIIQHVCNTKSGIFHIKIINQAYAFLEISTWSGFTEAITLTLCSKKSILNIWWQEKIYYVRSDFKIQCSRTHQFLVLWLFLDLACFLIKFYHLLTPLSLSIFCWIKV